MSYIAYVLINQDKKIYVGHTANLVERLKRHNGELPTKATSYTHRLGGVWKVLYSEEFGERSLAVNRERQLKSAQGRAFIKKLYNSEDHQMPL